MTANSDNFASSQTSRLGSKQNRCMCYNERKQEGEVFVAADRKNRLPSYGVGGAVAGM